MTYGHPLILRIAAWFPAVLLLLCVAITGSMGSGAVLLLAPLTAIAVGFAVLEFPRRIVVTAESVVLYYSFGIVRSYLRSETEFRLAGPGRGLLYGTPATGTRLHRLIRSCRIQLAQLPRSEELLVELGLTNAA